MLQVNSEDIIPPPPPHCDTTGRDTESGGHLQGQLGEVDQRTYEE